MSADLTQRDQILRSLKRGKTLTPMDALAQFDCFRLAARIAELRRDGHQIETIQEHRKGKRWARYRLRRAA